MHGFADYVRKCCVFCLYLVAFRGQCRHEVGVAKVLHLRRKWSIHVLPCQLFLLSARNWIWGRMRPRADSSRLAMFPQGKLPVLRPSCLNLAPAACSGSPFAEPRGSPAVLALEAPAPLLLPTTWAPAACCSHSLPRGLLLMKSGSYFEISLFFFFF
jgi:hypothetical protein